MPPGRRRGGRALTCNLKHIPTHPISTTMFSHLRAITCPLNTHLNIENAPLPSTSCCIPSWPSSRSGSSSFPPGSAGPAVWHRRCPQMVPYRYAPRVTRPLTARCHTDPVQDTRTCLHAHTRPRCPLSRTRHPVHDIGCRRFIITTRVVRWSGARRKCPMRGGFSIRCRQARPPPGRHFGTK